MIIITVAFIDDNNSFKSLKFTVKLSVIDISLVVEWNLRIRDTLGLAILSLVGRLSSFRRLKMYCIYTFGDIGSVLYREVLPFSEGPLLEVSL